MSAVSLQRSAALSLLLHISLFGAALLALRHANRFVLPSPYEITLVSPEAFSGDHDKTAKVPATKTPEKSQPERNAAMSVPKSLGRSEEKLLEERIRELRQTEKNKQSVEKKIQELRQMERGNDLLKTKLRELSEIEDIKKKLQVGEIVSVKKENPEAKIGPITEAAGNVEYGRLVGEEIRRQWQFPTDLLKDKTIEAIVSIRVLKNGFVQILRIEKSSGNPLFDRSALRAITKASPVTSPPHEMEIGVRFYP